MYYNYVEELNIRPEQILVYLRKSRADDPVLTVEEILSKHETILDEWAEKNLDGRIPEENRFREIVSGETVADRPEIRKILKLMESPKIKAILTVEVQRLSRGDLEDAGRLIKLLRYTDTLVITPTKTYNLSDEYDRDAFERELKRGNEFLEYQKRIMGRGRLLSVSQGNYIGSIPPYGYDKIWIMEGKRRCPTLAINEEKATVVRMIFDLFVNQDVGVNNICRYLDSLGIVAPKGEHWATPEVRDILSNVHYIGKVKWNRRRTVKIVEDSAIIETRPRAKDGEYLIYDGKHPAIISEELFTYAQEKKGRVGIRKSAGTKPRNPFAGLLFCQCGRAMSYRVFTDKSGKERCLPRLICENQIHCHTASCTFDEMLEAVSQILKKNIKDIELTADSNRDSSAMLREELLRTLEKKLYDIEARELAQWEAQADPDIEQRMPPDIFKKLNAKLQNEKAEVIEAIQNARQSMPSPEERQRRLMTLRDALEILNTQNADVEKKNRLLKACIERITYTREPSQRWTSKPIEIDVQMRVRSAL